jgi:RNA polymerase sigma-70 factor (ECF subfamily)
MEGRPTPEEGDAALRELMRRYQEGRMEAFEELYRRTLPLVRGYHLALTRDRASSEDLAQETFLQVHRSRQTYDPAFPVKPWLLGIARYVRLQRERKQHRRRAHEVQPADGLPEMPIPAEVEALGDRDAVQRALGRLPADRREAVVLHHVHGLSFREIAEVAGASEGAMRVRASRGMSELRRLLGGDDRG